MIFNAKNIKALKQNQKISCPGLNMWARGTKDGKQVYYLKYRLYGTQELKKIGTFTEKPVTKGKLKNILTPIEAQSKAEEIVSLAKQNINILLQVSHLETSSRNSLNIFCLRMNKEIEGLNWCG